MTQFSLKHGMLKAVTLALTAAYPLAVYFLLDRGEVRIVGLALLAIVALRLLFPGASQLQALGVTVVGIAFAAAITLTASETLVRLYPVAISGGLLLVFSTTIIRPPSMIQRIAVATGAVLDEAGVRYTRTLTMVWCGFFLVNGAIALCTAVLGSREQWVIYNGLLSYLIAGALFAGERLLRPRFQQHLSKPAAS